MINLNVFEVEKEKFVIKVEIKIEKEMCSIFWIFLVVIIFIVCDSKIVVSEIRMFFGDWGKNDVIEFIIFKLDLFKKYNMFLYLRNINDYLFNNIFIIVSINFFYGKVIIDIFEYRMVELDGMWLGIGVGSVKESKFWYKENIFFFEIGDYVLRVL